MDCFSWWREWDGGASYRSEKEKEDSSSQEETKQVWAMGAAPTPESQNSREYRGGGNDADNESGWDPEGD